MDNRKGGKDWRFAGNPFIDQRVREGVARFYGGDFIVPASRDYGSRDEIMAEVSSPGAAQFFEGLFARLDALDTEENAPSAGIRVHTQQITSSPDGNLINLQVVRPEDGENLPCVYYIHGGAMAVASCFHGAYRAWARLIAANGVAVVMVDFRNCELASSSPGVAPFPAGLNDCVSGLRWLHENSVALGIDPGAIVVAGESGGANLTLALGMQLKREGGLHLIRGLYAMAPFIGGTWPLEDCPSSLELNRVGADLHTNRYVMSYGLEAAQARNPLAWPIFADDQDVAGLPPVVIQIYEFDPLRDEGLQFYRLLLRAGVSARCHQLMGVTHAIEIIPLGACLDISRDTAGRIAHFARESRLQIQFEPTSAA